MRRSKTTIVVLLCAGGGLLGACAGVRPSCRVPEAAQLELESSDRVNPDEQGRSLPTQVVLYQVTDLTKLQAATMRDLNDPTAALGSTLVVTDDLTIYPGQVMVHRFKRDPKAEFLVVAAIYRTPQGESWRTAQEWPLPGDPCEEHDDEDYAPSLDKLRVRAFLEDSRISSINNYAKLPKRRCAIGSTDCSGSLAPTELPRAREGRGLTTFEQDPSEPRATMGAGAGP